MDNFFYCNDNNNNNNNKMTKDNEYYGLKTIGIVASCYVISSSIIESSMVRLSGRIGNTGSILVGGLISACSIWNVTNYRNYRLRKWLSDKRKAALLKG